MVRVGCATAHASGLLVVYQSMSKLLWFWKLTIASGREFQHFTAQEKYKNKIFKVIVLHRTTLRFISVFY